MVQEEVGVIEERSCTLAAKAVAGTGVLTLKQLSFQGVPLEAAPPCNKKKLTCNNFQSQCWSLR